MPPLLKGDDMTLKLAAMNDEKSHAMARQMGKWIDQVLKGYHKYCPGETWIPTVNVYEDDNQYTVVADLAGVSAEEIELNVEGRSMILAGQRSAPDLPDAEGDVKLHLMEIDHGRF